MKEGGRDRGMFCVAAICLVLTFVLRLLPSDESPRPTLHTLQIVLELCLVIGFVGLAPRVLRSLPQGSSRGGWIFLVVVGIVAALGLIGLRVFGGPRLELSPRTSIDSSEAAQDTPKRLLGFISTVETISERLVASRWMQALATRDPARVRTLTRRDLEDARAIYRDLLDSIDQTLKVFAEAESKRIDVSGASNMPGANRPETWRVAREGYSAAYDYMGVIDQHWDEWLANPFPDDETDLKAWQVDMLRLAGVTATRAKQFKALLESKSPPSAASSDAAALSKQLQEYVESLGKLNAKAMTLRWMTLKEDPATKRTRTRQDLREMRELYSQMRELVGRALKLLAEADSKGIDLSADQSEKYLGRPDFWRAMQRAYDATSENFALFDQNWDEWMAEVAPRDEKDLKPRQRERDRLNQVIAAALKQAKESAAAPVTPAPAPSPPGSNIKQLLKQAETFMAAPATPAPAPSLPGSHMDQLILKTSLLAAVAEYRESLARLRETRWVKSPNANAYHPQKITRADLHDANEKLRALIASIDRLRRDLDAVTVPVPAAEKEYWRLKRETSLAFQQLTGLLEENWKEWHVSGIEPKTGEIKSWQKEAGRLQGEVDKLKQIEQTSILL